MSGLLIISNSKDEHVDFVESKLREVIKVFRLNTDEFSTGEITLTLTEKTGFLRKKNNTLWLDQITSVWVRRPEVLKPEIQHKGQFEFAQGELQELLSQLYFLTPNAKWVSKWTSLHNARRKHPQLLLAQKLGFKVPQTCITNDPLEAQAFINKNPKATVYKTIRAPVLDMESNETLWSVPTSVISRQHISELDKISNSGGIFQEYIDKDYEIRVTIIGDDVFSTRIDSQNHPDKKVQTDWRDGVALGEVRLSPYCLPVEIEDKCRAMLKEYDLQFGAIDLIRSLDGEYIFLEINPNGQWIWVEEATGQPLIKSMIKLLTK